MNEQGEYWRDLRTVLAVAEEGSLSAAARNLGISHATVFRHINQIEEKLVVKLFERGREGYSLTAAGERLAALAGRFDQDLIGLERQIQGQEIEPAGLVRITTTDTLLINFLSPMLVALQQRFPEIELEIDCSNEIVNLNRRDADIALRPSKEAGDNMIGRRLSDIAMAIYCHKSYAQQHFQGHILSDLKEIPLAILQQQIWVGPGEKLFYLPLARWLREQGFQPSVRSRHNSLLAVADAVRAGAGLAVLPCFMADEDDNLLRIARPLPELTGELWLLTHPDLRNVGRIRACMDFLAEEVTSRRSLLEGRR
ncbi:LysR family transcriptional regulator [Kiloniella laminariae]|uniref:LysR family transcriptional regulator n=1 Tax=Kiloniella laminariae TaxID=454162 RepID=A0ABT4LEI8_9PROT|nr:LysR family transcriptional regulator [Kiloniella laminariae]MCZ4279516.1 LysR family transcriptional regulator [Kiloniella laminariae]